MSKSVSAIYYQRKNEKKVFELIDVIFFLFVLFKCLFNYIEFFFLSISFNHFFFIFFFFYFICKLYSASHSHLFRPFFLLIPKTSIFTFCTLLWVSTLFLSAFSYLINIQLFLYFYFIARSFLPCWINIII